MRKASDYPEWKEVPERLARCDRRDAEFEAWIAAGHFRPCDQDALELLGIEREVHALLRMRVRKIEDGSFYKEVVGEGRQLLQGHTDVMWRAVALANKLLLELCDAKAEIAHLMKEKHPERTENPSFRVIAGGKRRSA